MPSGQSGTTSDGSSIGEDSPLSIETVLDEEIKAIRGIGLPDGKNVVEHCHDQQLSALCLSGGGIRSATFALGVIQALAQRLPNQRSINNASNQQRNTLLSSFDYLSTVSGGGYTGSCLSAWIKRQGFATVAEGLTTSDPNWASAEAAAQTAKQSNVLSWLRNYTNYLTPKMGALSGDTWAAVTLTIRNIFLNWLVLIPLFLLGVFAIDCLAFFTAVLNQIGPNVSFLDWPYVVLPAGTGIFFVIALCSIARTRPSLSSKGVSAAFVNTMIIGPLCIGSICLCSLTLLATLISQVSALRGCSNKLIGQCTESVAWRGAIGGAGLYVLAKLLTAWGKRFEFYELIAYPLAGASFGALIGVGICLQVMLADRNLPLVILGLPWCLCSYLISDMVFVAFTSWEKDSDADREWLARLGGKLLIISVVWMIAISLVLLGGYIAVFLLDSVKKWIATLGFSGVVTAVLSFSKKTPARGPAQTTSGISANVVLAIAAPVFAASLIVLLAVLVDSLFFKSTLATDEFWSATLSPTQSSTASDNKFLSFVLGLLTLGISVVTSFFININRFSLHALYRNRIIRAFLGGSRPEREQTFDPFSGFDVRDNLPMYSLWKIEVDASPDAKNGGNKKQDEEIKENDWVNGNDDQWRPFHVINMALNLVAGKNLAWQERKAESFTVSPLHSGCQKLCFRDSEIYGDRRGISVGTAVAISGAAVSPNMGYHSSPALSFLLTLFNVRLGWWLGNPNENGKRTFMLEGPRFAARPLLAEMLGKTDDTHPYIYLSDGGHFENLGLYEMVRRRCRLIVVSDAGCDPTFGYEDLGNAIRKISIDLGITIRFPNLDELRPRTKKSERDKKEFASISLGEIDYSGRDGPSAPIGTLVYIKPTFYRDKLKNIGVRNYGVAHPEFPHESTADQWFTESQFESYRALGYEIMREYLDKCVAGRNRFDNLTDWLTPPKD